MPARAEAGGYPVSFPVLFGSIALNEETFIADCFEQHADLCDQWYVAEGADDRFPTGGGERGARGLSSDRTAEAAMNWMANSPIGRKVVFDRVGWKPDKIALRNTYAHRINDHIARLGLDRAIVVVIDIDEYLIRRDALALLDWMQRGYVADPKRMGAVRIPHVHFWRNASQIIRGGYYDIPHDRVYWWPLGAEYKRDHNHPEIGGRLLQELPTYVRRDRDLMFARAFDRTSDQFGANPRDRPIVDGLYAKQLSWFHFGFTKTPDEVAAKNEYYARRGERDTRPATHLSRAAFFQSDEENKAAGFFIDRFIGPWPEACLREPARYGIADWIKKVGENRRGLLGESATMER